MSIRTELSVRLPNSPGALGGLAQHLKDAAINVLGFSLDTSGQLRLVVDNHIHAAGMLRERDYTVQQRDVLYVQVPNSPGALAAICRMLATAGVNIEYAYASAIEGGHMAAAVVGVDDAVRASTATGL